MIDQTFSHTYLWKFSKKVSVFNWQTIQKCQLFIETPGSIWLSVIRVTDWLNTVTWLKHNSVCSPPQSCGGGTLIDTTKCFYLGKIFHANKWQNELAILSFQKCMLTALDRALAVYCAHSTLDTHCTARKKTPAALNCVNFYGFYEYYAGARQGNGEAYNITDGEFVVGNITKCT